MNELSHGKFAESFVLEFVIQKYKDQYPVNYKSSCCFVWV